MAEDSQKNLTYNQSQERLLDQTWAAMRNDPRLQGMMEGMAQSMLSMPDNLERKEIIRGLAQSLAREGTRLRLEQQPDGGPQPSQLNDDCVGALREQAESFIELRVDTLKHAREAGAKIAQSMLETPGLEQSAIDEQLGKIAISELYKREASTAATLGIEDVLAWRSQHGQLYVPVDAPQDLTPVIRAAASQIVAGSRERIDEIRNDMARDLKANPRNTLLAEYAMKSDDFEISLKTAVRRGAETEVYYDEKNPTPQSVRSELDFQIGLAAEKYVGPDGPEPDGRPFTSAEIESAAQQAIDANPDIVDQAISQGIDDALEEKEQWRRSLWEDAEQIEELPEGWLRSSAGTGYAILSPDGGIEYEYQQGHGSSEPRCRWNESAWTPADKGSDPVQQIKSRLQNEQAAAKEPEQDKVSALVQVTHTTGQQHDGQKLQARQQITRQAQSLDQARGR